MGDNKISEAVVRLACDAYDKIAQWGDVVNEFEAMNAALESALPHLQGEAVPVAWLIQRNGHTVACMSSKPGSLQVSDDEVVVPVFAHPQPAELSEVVNEADLYRHLLDMPGAEDYEDAGQIIGELHGTPMLCTCPSGDGSLRWPCPKDPPESAELAELKGDALRSFACEAVEYFRDRADIVDGDYGNPSPNEEMKLLSEGEAALAATGKQQDGENPTLDPGLVKWLSERDLLPDAHNGEIDMDSVIEALNEHERELMKPVQAGDVQGSRDQFEAWCDGRGYNRSPAQNNCGITVPERYAHPKAQIAWAAWQAALASRQPEGKEVVTVEGIIGFNRSKGEKVCVCCPDQEHHIHGRYVVWEGERWSQMDALETALRKNFLYKNQCEGKRLRVSISLIGGRDAGTGVGR